jgi:hypothetical protein
VSSDAKLLHMLPHLICTEVVCPCDAQLRLEGVNLDQQHSTVSTRATTPSQQQTVHCTWEELFNRNSCAVCKQ